MEETTNNRIDDSIKISKFYDSSRMRKFVNYMEFFAELMNEKTASEEKRRKSKLLFEHYRRMVLNQAVKEIPDDFHVQDVLDMKDVIRILEDRIDSKST